ncbi:MAG TPA: RNA-binding protein S1 [Firmicutes bacterium]|nr:RNA-binding protein S1 [Bacillota bacterium]
MSSIEIGSIVEGVVTGITNFGAFVELAGGKVGLIHISEVADVYVKDVREFLKESEVVKVKVLSIDEKGKIGLSIKALQKKPSPATDGRRKPSMSFEDKLSKFMKDSDERLLDLKRNTESKRGGRGGGVRSK